MRCLRLLESARPETIVVRAEVEQSVWSVQCRKHQDQNKQAGANNLLWQAWNYSPRSSEWDRAVSVEEICAKGLEEIGISQGAVEWLVYVHEFAGLFANTSLMTVVSSTLEPRQVQYKDLSSCEQESLYLVPPTKGPFVDKYIFQNFELNCSLLDKGNRPFHLTSLIIRQSICFHFP